MLEKKISVITSSEFGFVGPIVSSLGLNTVTVYSLKPIGRSFFRVLKMALLLKWGFITYVMRHLRYRKILKRAGVLREINSLDKIDASGICIFINFDTLVRDERFLRKWNVLNFHPSILPNFKGLFPIPRAVHAHLMGEKVEFGFTLHLLDKKFDSGACVSQHKVSISNIGSMFSLYEAIYNGEVIREALHSLYDI